MRPKSKLNILIGIVALSMAAYHMIYTQVLLLEPILHYNTHLGFCLLIVFLSSIEAHRKRISRTILTLMAILSLLCVAYVAVFYEDLLMRIWFNTSIDLIIGVLLIFLVLEAARQSFGAILPLLALAVALYPTIGHLIPEPFHCTFHGFSRSISDLSIGLQSGIYGVTLPISANFVFLFVLFGGVLKATGATKFFVLLGKWAGKKVEGGAGMMSVISSALLGSVVGSVAANIAITGAFTIPLMKKMGYKPHEAAAIEAAASNGGQIMPPIMGVVAFAMAGLTGIPYLKIVLMALLPAILYFLSCGAYVIFKAMKIGMGRIEDEINTRELLWSAPSFLTPIVVIFVMLTIGFSVMYTAFWTIISAIVASLIGRQRPSLSSLIQGFIDGAKVGAGIGAMIASMGILVTTFTTSGLGIKLSSGIEAWSGGSLLLALIIIGGMCVLMGMGGPAIASYIIVSIFAVPALRKMGLGLEESHFFVMFATTFAFVTPPVAIGALVAAKLSGASYIHTAIEATKVAFAGFLLPFMFIYCPAILLQPQEAISALTGLLSCAIILISFQVAFVGYFFGECHSYERVLMAMSAILLFIFLVLKSYSFFVMGIALFIILVLWHRTKIRLQKGFMQVNLR